MRAGSVHCRRPAAGATPRRRSCAGASGATNVEKRATRAAPASVGACQSGRTSKCKQASGNNARSAARSLSGSSACSAMTTASGASVVAPTGPLQGQRQAVDHLRVPAQPPQQR